MTAALDLSLVPPLGEPRPQPVPAAAGVDAAQRPARGRRAAPGRAADRAAPAGALRRVELGDRRRRTPPAAPCSPARSCWARRRTTRPASPSCCRATAPSCRSPPTPTGCCSATTLLPGRPRPGAGRARRAAHRRHLPRRPRRGRAGPRRRADRHRPVAARRHRPGRAGRPPLRRPPVRHRAARRRARRRRGRRRRCAACTASGSCPAGSTLVLVGDLDPRGRDRRRRRRAGRLDRHRHRRRGAAGARRCTRRGSSWSTGPGAVQSNLRLGGPAPAPHRSRPRRRPAGQHDLRRLLLLPAGREHPRAPRLHLQPAQLRRPPGGRLLVPRRGRRRHRGDRSGAAGDLVRARPHGADCRSPRPSWTAPAATSSAAWRCPPRPTPGLASTLSALVGAGPAGRAGWPSTSRRWPRSPSSRSRRPPAATWRRPR